MTILKKDTLLVFVNSFDVDESGINTALLGTIVTPSKNKPELIIPTKDNQIYFKSGTKLLHDIGGSAKHDWFLVNKSDVLVKDTKKFKSHKILIH